MDAADDGDVGAVIGDDTTADDTAGRLFSELRDRSPVAASLLPDVVHETPAAILLVDLDSGDVVYANSLAGQLAPGMRLPIAVDDWSRAAGLEDIGGDDLAGDRGSTRPDRGQPLSRVARGEPVMGEAVTAARSNSGFERREPLWVVGLPLAEAPGPLGRQAVVVFLPIRRSAAVAGAQESAASLRDRALLATRISITISDPSQPDNPLIWVNPAFLEITGYSSEDVLGHNCRFLQGPETDRGVIAEIRAAIEGGTSITTTVRNYRADRTPFWNQVSISPVLDGSGRITHFVGVQADVTERVEAEHAQEATLAEIRLARDRLALLAATTNRLAASLDPVEIVRLLSELVVPRLGAWSITFTVEGDDDDVSAYVFHPGLERDHRLREVAAAAVPELQDLPEDHVVRQMLRGEREAMLVADWASTGGHAAGPGVSALASTLGVTSVVLAPVSARGQILGVFALVSDPSSPTYDQDDVAVLSDVTTRAGLALDNARLFAHEHLAAETLQRALLPTLPTIDGLDVSAQYLPATARRAVGGDWYDVLRLRDDAGVGIAIGDVMGHDLVAAAAMGQLRSVLRSYAYPGARPAAVLEQLDQLVQSLQMGSLATCVYGRLTRAVDSRDAEFVWSNAGHPPPLLVAPDGRVDVLRTSVPRIVGVPFTGDEERGLTGAVRDEGRVVVPVGSTLVLYTDGLVEDRGTDIDSGIEELRALLAEQAAGLPASDLVSRLVERRSVAERGDDVAVLAVRVL